MAGCYFACIRSLIFVFSVLNILRVRIHFTPEYFLVQKSIENRNGQIEFVTTIVLIPVLLLFVFGFFLYYRQKRESVIRETELELRYEKAEMEMRALRAQVNPHFIFNCLNSIQYAIHQNKNELAERYLVKFSRLIRKVLEFSSSTYVSLSEDIEVMNLYVELEKMRLENQFTHEVNVHDDIDPEVVLIPSLLIQPLVENSIWHGLNNRVDKKGKLNIDYYLNESKLTCVITDNGRKGSFQSDHDHKSFGLKLVKERIQLHSRVGDEPILDIQEIIGARNVYEGMKVTLEIPFEL